MNKNLVLAVAVAVAIAVMMKVAPMMSVSEGKALIAFAIFFGAGGGIGGLTKSLAGFVTGAIWMIIANMIVASNQASFGDYQWVFLAIVGLIIVLQSRVSMLSYLPASLGGAALAAGAPAFRPFGLLVIGALILGGVLGFAADAVASMAAKKS